MPAQRTLIPTDEGSIEHFHSLKWIYSKTHIFGETAKIAGGIQVGDGKKDKSVLTLSRRLPSRCARIAWHCTNVVQSVSLVSSVTSDLHSTWRYRPSGAYATAAEFFAVETIGENIVISVSRGIDTKIYTTMRRIGCFYGILIIANGNQFDCNYIDESPSPRRAFRW